MGMTATYGAFRCVEQEKVQSFLGLKQSNRVYERDIYPSPIRHANLIFTTVTDWVVIIEGSSEPRILSKESMVSASKQWNIVTAIIEERTNYFSASEFKDGKEIWNAVHDLQRAQNHLEVTGEPSSKLNTVIATLSEEYANTPREEMYDIFSSLPDQVFIEYGIMNISELGAFKTKPVFVD
ncbi:hypothetical protein KF728_05855 [Candidatus Obscuribacterales bacterium]|nr:hypothetical protein [Candidatus Obscuribacterales bacterium]